MRLVDAHCHLEAEEFAGQTAEILEEAAGAGIIALITAAIRPEQWPITLSLSKTFPGVYGVLGIHPWYGREEDIPAIDTLPEFLAQGAVGVGEIGLDTKIEDPPLSVQTTIFERQLTIARELNLPLNLHCRGAFNEMLAIFRRIGVPERGGILHNFCGSAEIARSFMDYGMAFSLGGVLTYRNSRKRKDLLNRIYPDAFLLETDSPDLAPVEARERPNRPANIRYNLRAAAEILDIPEAEIAEKTTRNAERIFRLSPDWQCLRHDNGEIPKPRS